VELHCFVVITRPLGGTGIASEKVIWQELLKQPRAGSRPGAKPAMAYKETFWMACDSTEQLRAEYGPFHTRAEAESEARKLGFGYLLRYEHLLGPNEEIEEVRCIFIELQGTPPIGDDITLVSLHTRCATCGECAVHEKGWQAEVWADIHEFEHSRHRVRLFEHAKGKGLKEVSDWRG
jgi:ribosomal protein S27E